MYASYLEITFCQIALHEKLRKGNRDTLPKKAICMNFMHVQDYFSTPFSSGPLSPHIGLLSALYLNKPRASNNVKIVAGCVCVFHFGIIWPIYNLC